MSTVKERRRDQRGRMSRARIALRSDGGQDLLHILAERFDHRVAHMPGDPFSTAFRDGQRSVMLEIKRLCDTEESFDDEIELQV